jgi:hypothetical protein
MGLKYDNILHYSPSNGDVRIKVGAHSHIVYDCKDTDLGGSVLINGLPIRIESGQELILETTGVPLLGIAPIARRITGF